MTFGPSVSSEIKDEYDKMCNVFVCVYRFMFDYTGILKSCNYITANVCKYIQNTLYTVACVRPQYYTTGQKKGYKILYYIIL